MTQMKRIFTDKGKEPISAKKHRPPGLAGFLVTKQGTKRKASPFSMPKLLFKIISKSQ